MCDNTSVFTFCTVAPSRAVHLSVVLAHVNARTLQSLLSHLKILWNHLACTKNESEETDNVNTKRESEASQRKRRQFAPNGNGTLPEKTQQRDEEHHSGKANR